MKKRIPISFFSASMKRTLGIARTEDLNGPWTIDPQPIVSPEEQIKMKSQVMNSAKALGLIGLMAASFALSAQAAGPAGEASARLLAQVEPLSKAIYEMDEFHMRVPPQDTCGKSHLDNRGDS